MNKVHPSARKKSHSIVSDIVEVSTDTNAEPPENSLSNELLLTSLVLENASEGGESVCAIEKPCRLGSSPRNIEVNPNGESFLLLKSRGGTEHVCAVDYTTSDMKVKEEQAKFILKDRLEEEKLKSGFIDKNARVDEFDSALRSEEERLMELEDKKIIETEQLIQKDKMEEARLKKVFVDKNVRDDEFDLAVRAEEEKLIKLKEEEENDQSNYDLLKVHKKEEERLKDMFHQNKVELYRDDELSRLEAILRTRGTDSIALVDMNSDPDVEEVAENVKLISTGILDSALTEEIAHDMSTQQTLHRLNNAGKEERHFHQQQRQTEEARLRHLYRRSEAQTLSQARILVKQDTRRNLSIVDDEKIGKLVQKTARGLLRFEMNESFEFGNVTENNRHISFKDCEMVGSKKRHILNENSSYENKICNLIFSEEATLIHKTEKIHDFDNISDETGKKRHNSTDDCTIHIITRKQLIPDSSYILAINNHDIPKDMAFEHRKVHDLHPKAMLYNVNKSHDICKPGIFVQRASKMRIPHPNTTEFKSSSVHYIPSENSVVNRSKQFVLHHDSYITNRVSQVDLCEDGDLLPSKMTYTIPECGSQDEHARVYILQLEGSMDAHSNTHINPSTGTLIHNTRHNIPPARTGDVANKCNHWHRDKESYSPWRNSEFSIPSSGSLQHSARFNECHDANWKLGNNAFHIANELSIDEEYLQEDSE